MRASPCGGNLPWLVAQLSKPEATQEMRRRLRDDVDPFKWIAVGLLALLRDHDWPASLQGSYLPVDVQHLRFKKRRAITGDDGERVSCHVDRGLQLPQDHCSSV